RFQARFPIISVDMKAGLTAPTERSPSAANVRATTMRIVARTVSAHSPSIRLSWRRRAGMWASRPQRDDAAVSLAGALLVVQPPEGNAFEVPAGRLWP